MKPDVIKSGGKKNTDAAAKPAVKTATKSQDLMRNSILLFLERPPGKIQRGKEKQAHAQVPRKNNKSSRERIIDKKARRSTHNQKEKRQARPERGKKKGAENAQNRERKRSVRIVQRRKKKKNKVSLSARIGSATRKKKIAPLGFPFFFLPFRRQPRRSWCARGIPPCPPQAPSRADCRSSTAPSTSPQCQPAPLSVATPQSTRTPVAPPHHQRA